MTRSALWKRLWGGQTLRSALLVYVGKAATVLWGAISALVTAALIDVPPGVNLGAVIGTVAMVIAAPALLYGFLRVACRYGGSRRLRGGFMWRVAFLVWVFEILERMGFALAATLRPGLFGPYFAAEMEWSLAILALPGTYVIVMALAVIGRWWSFRYVSEYTEATSLP